MSWESYLEPRPKGAEFSPAALAAMNAWWEDYPIYRRSDGAIALCRDKDYSESVVFEGTQDEVDVHVEVIAIEPKRITFGIMGWPDSRLDAIYAFMRFCLANWPCELLDQTESPDTPEQFREDIIKLNDE